MEVADPGQMHDPLARQFAPQFQGAASSLDETAQRGGIEIGLSLELVNRSLLRRQTNTQAIVIIGERQMLELRHFADRHVRPGSRRTIHSAQGATATHIIAHMESFRANAVDTRAGYVAVSRAKTHATIYTDDHIVSRLFLLSAKYIAKITRC